MATSSLPVVSFNPEDFFSYAGSIVSDANSNEAALRSAISRAYYSMFLIARDRLFGLDQVQLNNTKRKQVDKQLLIQYSGKRKKQLGVHERVILCVCDKTQNITLYQQLDQLREARVNADYKMSHSCLSTVGKTSWREYAEETLQLSSQILPDLKRLASY